jgi:hypothetical protein
LVETELQLFQEVNHATPGVDSSSVYIENIRNAGSAVHSQNKEDFAYSWQLRVGHSLRPSIIIIATMIMIRIQ